MTPLITTALLRAALSGLLLFSGVWVALHLLRKRSADARRLLLGGAFCALLVASVGSLFAPKISVGLPGVLRAERNVIDSLSEFGPDPQALPPGGTAGPAARRAVPPSPAAGAATETHRRQNLATLAFWLWAVLAVLALLRTIRSFALAYRLTKRARPIVEASVIRRFKAIALEAGVRQPPPLLEHAETSTPMTVGTFSSIIVLPRTWREWGEDRLQAVLLHELAHVIRRDCLVQAISRFCADLHWFNPLVHLAFRRLKIERELAADDFVLNAGKRPAAYARDLVAIASALAPARLGAAMAAGSDASVTSRVEHILAPGHPRRAATMKFVAPAFGALAAAALALGCVRLEPASTSAAGALSPALNAQVEKRVGPLLAELGEGSLVIGVLRGERTRVFGFGRAPGNSRARPDGDTVFEVGSITELFTNLALAAQASEGRVDLKAQLGHLLPELISNEALARVTLLDLATHTSGLPPLPTNFVEQDRSTAELSYTDSMLRAFLEGYASDRAAPRFRYSYLGPGLLALALARGERTSYRDLVASRVIAPLHLDSTEFFGSSARLASRMALGHEGRTVVPARMDMPVLGGCCAIRTTANDLLRFARANLDPDQTPLGRAIRETQSPRFEYRPHEKVGLGWHIGRNGVLFKRGGGRGFKSFIRVYPARREAVIVLASVETIDAETLAFGISHDLLLGGVESEVIDRSVSRATLSKLPGDAISSDAEFGQRIRLLGWRLDRDRVTPGTSVGVRLYYRALAPIDRDLAIFVHADGPRGQPRLNLDHHPVAGLVPTDRWKVGAIIEDAFSIAIPPDYRPGALVLWTGWYDAAGRVHLTNTAPSDGHDRVRGPTIEIIEGQAGDLQR